MIPYDDLVSALANWRARQGLPVAQLTPITGQSPATTAPVPVASAAAPAARTTAPRSAPATPPPRSGPVAAPPPLAPADMDVDDSALLEEAAYDPEGDDFAMAFNKLHHQDHEAEATAIGMGPGPNRDSFGGGATQPESPPGGKRRNDDDW